MSFNVNEIKAQLNFGGARPTQFQVQITNPSNSIADLKTPFMVKAASLPSSNLGTIEAGYFGRKIKLAGDRTFEPWTVTVYNDEDFLIRNAMEEWMNRINRHQQNVTDLPQQEYKSQANIIQFGKDGTALRTYNFNGLFPTNVSEITMDWDSTDTIEEFTVTFEYDWWTIADNSITGNAGGS